MQHLFLFHWLKVHVGDLSIRENICIYLGVVHEYNSEGQ